MSVTIRLTRAGSKKVPFYRVVAADSRSPRWRSRRRPGTPRSPAARPRPRRAPRKRARAGSRRGPADAGRTRRLPRSRSSRLRGGNHASTPPLIRHPTARVEPGARVPFNERVTQGFPGKRSPTPPWSRPHPSRRSKGREGSSGAGPDQIHRKLSGPRGSGRLRALKQGARSRGESPATGRRVAGPHAGRPAGRS